MLLSKCITLSSICLLIAKSDILNIISNKSMELMILEITKVVLKGVS